MLSRWIGSPESELSSFAPSSRHVDELRCLDGRHRSPRIRALSSNANDGSGHSPLLTAGHVPNHIPSYRRTSRLALRRDYTSLVFADVRHLLRNIRRSPASALAAIVTLSLTLGAGAAIFAVVDAVVLTPPPFANPDSLVIVGETPIDDRAAAPRAVGYRTFEQWRERAGSLAAMEASDGTNLTMTELGAAERVRATNVTPGFLTLLGVTPALGRAFDLDDVGTPVVIVSHAFWRGKLAADPRVIGRRLVLGGQSHTIIGVLPERFSYALDTRDLWRPFPSPCSLPGRPAGG